MQRSGIGGNSIGLGVGVGLASIAMCIVRSRRAAYSIAVEQRLNTPPRLPKRPHMVPFGKVEGQNRGNNPMEPILYLDDPYFYVRDDTRKNKEVIEHLEKENAYTKHQTRHLTNVQDNLYTELLSHVQETDEDYPHPHDQYLYYTRTVKGNSYTFHCRKNRHDPNAKEELLLDENELARGHKHCEVGTVRPSPDHNLLVYTVDNSGYETYTAYIKDLRTGKLLTDKVENIASSISWGADNSTLYYGTFDSAHRRNKVWRHNVGSSGKDECLYIENDEIFSAYFGKSRSGKYLFITSSSSETSESHFIDLTKPGSKLTQVEKRVKGVEYSMDHMGEKFLIETNKDEAVNFKIMETSIIHPGASHWKDVFPYDPSIKVDGLDCFESFFVIYGRQHGFTQIWVVNNTKAWSTSTSVASSTLSKSQLIFSEPIYTLGRSVNREYSTKMLRFTYTSMTTPRSIYDYNVDTKEKTLLKEKPVPNYNRDLYQCERLEAKADDGTLVPISIVYRKDQRKKDNKPQPLHLYGYGSYEISIDPVFNASILPLIDRGVIYAIAHIRGGGEMGRTWYESSKYCEKKKTFTDFINVAEHLIAKHYTSPSQLTCEGRSAGGLLMGAVLNMRPDLFVGAIAGVPFVDVMCTMSDATIPLTTGEWEEWGNPNEIKYFQYMLSYSPYENVKRQHYPNMLITSGLYDPRVAYWEPTKWVAKLRDYKLDENKILLKMDLSSGHFSASDRYFYLKEKSFDLSFLLDQLKCVQDTDRKISKL